MVAGLTPEEARLFDSGTMGAFVHRVITEAAKVGNCVIVGRGSQCILQTRPDVFHVFVYAPWEQRVERVKRRVEPDTNVEELIRSTDGERAHYIRSCFGCDWKEPHLYHMMISSEMGTDSAAATIIDEVRTSGAIARIRVSIPIATT